MVPSRRFACSLTAFAILISLMHPADGEAQNAGAGAGLLRHLPPSNQAALLIPTKLLQPGLDWLGRTPQAQQELSDYLNRELGVDLSRAEGVVISAKKLKNSFRLSAFILLKNATPLKGKAVGRHRGQKLLPLGENVVASRLPGGIVIGNMSGVKHFIDFKSKKGKTLKAGSPLGALLAIDSTKAKLYFGLSLTDIPPKALPPAAEAIIQRYDLRAITFSYDIPGVIQVALAGDPTKLPQARELVVSILETFVAGFERQKAKAVTESNIVPAVASIVGVHLLKEMTKEIEPRMKGDLLVASYRLPKDHSTLLLPMAGVSAAIAIPAFIKYLRKAKTVEAIQGLDQIKAGAKAFYQADHYDPQSGNLLPKRFPPNTGWTPKRSCCEDKKGKGKCLVSTKAWNTSAWRALQFSMNEPHYYQWRFVSSGKGADASFTAQARGDLDCDGIPSNFEIWGSSDGQGGVKVKGPIIRNEIE